MLKPKKVKKRKKIPQIITKTEPLDDSFLYKSEQFYSIVRLSDGLNIDKTYEQQ